MKFKNFKSKMVAGLLAMGVLGGVTFASTTGAGVQLRNWYTTKANAAKTEAFVDLQSYAKEEEAGLLSSVQKIKNVGVQTVKEHGSIEKGWTTDAIKGMKTKHSGDIKAENDKIAEGIQGEFTVEIGVKNSLINGYLDGRALAAQEDITAAMDKMATTKLGEITEQGNKTKSEEVAALTEEIANAKREIEADIKTQKERATGEMKTNFDEKAKALIATIGEDTDNLVDAKDVLFREKSQEMIEAAKNELDALVNAIDAK